MSKKNVILNEVKSYQVETLQNFSTPQTFNTSTELIYEGQIPMAGYLLIEGEIHFLKRKTVFQKILPGTLFGVSELMSHTPIKFTVKILPGSKVCILDRSTVKELLEFKDKDDLPSVFKDLPA